MITWHGLLLFYLCMLLSWLFQLGKCRSVTEFEKLNRVGEGTYGIVCKFIMVVCKRISL